MPTVRPSSLDLFSLCHVSRVAPLLAVLSAAVVACGGSETPPRAEASAPVMEASAPVVAAPSRGDADHGSNCQDHEDEDEHDQAHALRRRHDAARRVGWRHPRGGPGKQVAVKLLGFNDFHGQLSPRVVSGRPAGGAAVLASYLRAAAASSENGAIIAHAGDHVGASPPNSALLQDEPAISFLNLLGNRFCGYTHRFDPRCNVVGTLGNHEFDEGVDELNRLISGGNAAGGPFLEAPWRGATFPYISSNVIVTATGQPLLPPFVIKRLGGVSIGFIGAVLKGTPSIVTPSGVAGLSFIDEAPAINEAVRALQAKGVHAIVVQIHQGGGQPSFTGPTDAGTAAPTGAIMSIIEALDDDVDVVISGHTHQFTNALVNNASGVPMLLTQAFSAGTAYSDIDITVDAKTGDVTAKSASIVTTWGDQGPGLVPDAAMAELVARADAQVAPLVQQVIGQAAADITRTTGPAGESALGNLIAESQRVAVGAQFAFMNQGGIRADLFAGDVTWGELFTIQPFGNTVTKLTLTGQQIVDLLNQQWGAPQPAGGRILQIAGLGYTWDAAIPEGGARVVEVHDASGRALDPSASYVVAVNNFIAAGGDNFTVLRSGLNQVGGPVDLDALIAYIRSVPQPFSGALDGRIRRLN